MIRRAVAFLAALCLLLTGQALAGIIGSGERDVFGDTFNASAIQYPVNMIVIWATWCGYCVREIPDMNALANDYKGKLGVAGITMDAVVNTSGTLSRDEDAISSARQIMQGARFQSVVPSESLMNKLRGEHVQTMPTVWFTDKAGTILYTVTGVLKYDDWRAIIDMLMEGQ